MSRNFQFDFLLPAISSLSPDDGARVAKAMDCAILYGALQCQKEGAIGLGAESYDQISEIYSQKVAELSALIDDSTFSSDQPLSFKPEPFNPMSEAMKVMPQLIALFDKQKPTRLERMVSLLISSASVSPSSAVSTALVLIQDIDLAEKVITGPSV